MLSDPPSTSLTPAFCSCSLQHHVPDGPSLKPWHPRWASLSPLTVYLFNHLLNPSASIFGLWFQLHPLTAFLTTICLLLSLLNNHSYLPSDHPSPILAAGLTTLSVPLTAHSLAHSPTTLPLPYELAPNSWVAFHNFLLYLTLICLSSFISFSVSYLSAKLDPTHFSSMSQPSPSLGL